MSLALIIVLLLIIAFLVSLLGSISGVGGGVLFVPIFLIILNDQTLSQIKFLSTLLVFVSSSINVGIYFFTKRLSWKIFLISVIVSIPVIFCGFELSKIIPDLVIKVIIIIILTVVTFLLIFETKIRNIRMSKNDKANVVSEKVWYKIKYLDYNLNVFGLIGVIIAGGLITSISGMGGGPLLMPLLIIIFGLTMSAAIPISHTIISISSLITLISGYDNFLNYDLMVKDAVPMIIGVILGTFCSILLKKVFKSEKVIKWILIILIWLSIAKIVYDFL